MGSVGNTISAGTSLTTSDEIDDMLMDLSDADFKRVMSVRGNRYFGNDFGRDLNAFLASGNTNYLYERPDYQGAITELDNAMVSIPRQIVSERYVDEYNLPGFNASNPESIVGKMVATPGYLSTTLNASNSKFEFSNYPAKLIIKAPSGTKAILGANNKEAEVLYHRNSKYKITSYVIGKNQYGNKQIVYQAILIK